MRRRLTEGRGIDSHTLFLAHFDGNFKDEITGKEISGLYGTKYPVLSMSNPKFGNGCLTGNYGEVSDFRYLENADIDYNNTKEITIDMWIKCTAPASATGLRLGSLRANAAGYGQLGINVNYGGYFCILNNSSTSSWQSTAKVYKTPIDSSWHHFAMVCNNGVCTLFLDGKIVYTTTRTIKAKRGDLVSIFCESGNFLDEIRISDIARYTSDFTVPTKPY